MKPLVVNRRGITIF